MTFNSSSRKPSFIVAVLLLVGLAILSDDARNPGASAPAFAGGVGVANEETEIVFTSSNDGKTIYMWQYYSSKPPKYLGKSEAILTK